MDKELYDALNGELPKVPNGIQSLLLSHKQKKILSIIYILSLFHFIFSVYLFVFFQLYQFSMTGIYGLFLYFDSSFILPKLFLLIFVYFLLDNNRQVENSLLFFKDSLDLVKKRQTIIFQDCNYIFASIYFSNNKFKYSSINKFCKK